MKGLGEDRIHGVPGIDTLTGLNDRSWVDRINEEYLDRDGPWSLLMIDVDHFKLINDIYGHLVGDKVLKQAALTIQVNLKESDTAIRFGGDEFIVVLPNTDKDGALDLCQRLIFEIRRVSFSSGLKASISIGVSESRNSDSSITDLVSRADKALYGAKETGRGRFYFFSEKMTEKSAPQINFSHLVGRRTELHKLRQLLEESITESARFAIISGEDGVGKTRLADELLNYCDFMKSIVIRNSVMEHTQTQPFHLLIKPVSDAIKRLSQAELKMLEKRVEPLHPATLDLFPMLNVRVSDDLIYFREERIRFRIFRDVSAILTGISELHPITLILDDLQWVSEPDLALLSFMARNVTEAHVLFLCIMLRDDSSEDIYRQIASLNSSIPLLNIELEKLSDEEMKNLILFALRDPNVPTGIQDFLIAQSGGNPLFLRELLISLVDSGFIYVDSAGEKTYGLPEDLQVPESIGQIITKKLSGITNEAVDLLKIVSLSPDRFSLDLLEGMTGRDSVELARRLDECIKEGLIEEIHEGSAGISFRFTHGAVRDYLSSDLPESLKITYHHRIASYFEGFYRKGRGELLTEIAYHYSRSHDDEKAAAYALKAADQAFSRGANRDAIDWYNTYLRRVEDETEDDTGLFKVYMNLGSLYSITGEVEMAEDILKRSIQMASDDREVAAVHLKLGRNNLNSSLYPETLDYYNKAREICSRGDLDDPVIRRTMIETLIETSFVNRLQGNYDEAFACLERSEELMDGLPDATDDILALYYTRKADVISEFRSLDSAIEYYEKALEIYQRTGDLPGQATVLNNMHGVYSSKGDYASTLNILEEVIRLNTSLDDRLGLAIAYYNTAEYYQEINMLDLSREYYDKYMEMNDLIKNELGNGYGSYGLARLYWLRGDLEKSRFCFENAIEIFQRLSVDSMTNSCQLMIAQIYIFMDQFDLAREILDSIDEETLNPTVELNTRFMKGLVILHDPASGEEDINRAVEMFKKVINAPEHSEVDIAMEYSALVDAFDKLGRKDEKLVALEEGSWLLAEKLARIRSYSIRNSIMTRREISDFISVCRENGLPFPPEGIIFDTAAEH